MLTQYDALLPELLLWRQTADPLSSHQQHPSSLADPQTVVAAVAVRRLPRT